MRRKNVVIADVAKLARVSPSTVSRALNGKSVVNEATRARVLEAARKLGYEIREPSAREPVLENEKNKGRTVELCLPVPSLISDWLFAKIIQGMTSELKRRGGQLVISTLEKGSKAGSLRDWAPGRGGLLGVILGGGPVDPQVISRIQEAGLPLVLFDRYDFLGQGNVTVDNVSGARDAVAHLLSLGHRRIGLVNGPATVPACRDRLNGYRLALYDAGVEFDEQLVAIDEAYHAWQGGQRAALRLLQQPQRPSAIFASDDLMALGVIKAAEEMNLRVPEDLAVVGVGDVLYERTGISLTSVHIDYVYHGVLLVRVLYDIAEGRVDRPVEIALRGSLVVRESSGHALKASSRGGEKAHHVVGQPDIT